jgi:DNA-binding transcriptional regulator YiaG
MTPEQFKAARLAAGLATQKAAADALESDLRTVRRWENGERAVPGPVRVALRLMLQTAPSSTAHPEMPAA